MRDGTDKTIDGVAAGTLVEVGGLARRALRAEAEAEVLDALRLSNAVSQAAMMAMALGVPQEEFLASAARCWEATAQARAQAADRLVAQKEAALAAAGDGGTPPR